MPMLELDDRDGEKGGVRMGLIYTNKTIVHIFDVINGERYTDEDPSLCIRVINSNSPDDDYEYIVDPREVGNIREYSSQFSEDSYNIEDALKIFFNQKEMNRGERTEVLILFG